MIRSRDFSRRYVLHEPIVFRLIGDAILEVLASTEFRCVEPNSATWAFYCNDGFRFARCCWRHAEIAHPQTSKQATRCVSLGPVQVLTIRLEA
jgi:hypothetical protein